MEKHIWEIDSNMKTMEGAELEELVWYPIENPIRLTGFEYFKEDKRYRRLPLNTKELFERVNPNLNELCENTAGGEIAFRTDSGRIAVHVELTYVHDMVNMTAAGQCGFDCYVARNGERYKFYGITKFDIRKKSYACEVVNNLNDGTVKDILLNFPHYCGVKRVMIGLEEGAQLLEPRPFARNGKLVFYGTSITQGGCATRPGMAYTNIISRRLNMEHLNYGFSANGLGEYEMAELLSEVENPALYMLDYEANAGTNGRLEKSLEKFVEIIREKKPATPLLVVSRLPYLADYYDEEAGRRREELRKFQKDFVDMRRKAGDSNIYFVSGKELWDEDFDEYTVDFIHPTDLGFYKMAEKLTEIIQEILNENTANEGM